MDVLPPATDPYRGGLLPWVREIGIHILPLRAADQAAALGPDGTKFAYQLIPAPSVSRVVILGAAVVTVLAGIWLLVITSNGLDPGACCSAHRGWALHGRGRGGDP